MAREIRYQGAIIKDDHILLIRHREHDTGRSYWILPGGGIEPGETDEQCVCREMLEETHLTVAVERLLIGELIENPKVYTYKRTYLCSIISGEAKPGYEPEEEVQAEYGIVEVKWFDLRAPHDWDDLVKTDEITHPQLLKLREALGYAEQ